jgi:3'(2'), 5'-bisphosphate nucleotidase
MNDHALAKELATQAGNILLEVLADYKPLDPENPSADEIKALGDLGDTTANEFLINQLKRHRPDDVVLSEESVDPESRHGAQRVWIIDPLDGTASFSRGFPGFAVHVALWESQAKTPSKITAAAVNVPVVNTTLATSDSVVWISEFDSGVHGNMHRQAVGWTLSEREDIRIVASASNPPTQLDAICSVLTDDFSKDVTVESRGSVGAKLAYIIRGHADIYVNTSGFYEWDIAAPLAIAHHYGLTALLPDGSDFQFNQVNVEVAGAIICRPKYAHSILQVLADKS